MFQRLWKDLMSFFGVHQRTQEGMCFCDVLHRAARLWAARILGFPSCSALENRAWYDLQRGLTSGSPKKSLSQAFSSGARKPRDGGASSFGFSPPSTPSPVARTWSLRVTCVLFGTSLLAVFCCPAFPRPGTLWPSPKTWLGELGHWAGSCPPSTSGSCSQEDRVDIKTCHLHRSGCCFLFLFFLGGVLYKIYIITINYTINYIMFFTYM